jgi:hypothetical protein
MPTRQSQINPGKAGPKGALELPAAKSKGGSAGDNHSQHPWAETSKDSKRKKSRKRS